VAETVGRWRAFQRPVSLRPAKWLTEQGYKTTSQQIKDAKRQGIEQGLVLGLAPRTGAVMSLFDLLRQTFRDAKLEALLV
jgi:hypothetical protein